MWSTSADRLQAEADWREDQRVKNDWHNELRDDKVQDFVPQDEVWIISIGRTKGCYPMPSNNWAAFVSSLQLLTSGHKMIFSGFGVGSTDGCTEESYTRIVSAGTHDEYLELKESLAALAREFGQESIALTTRGVTESVRA